MGGHIHANMCYIKVLVGPFDTDNLVVTEIFIYSFIVLFKHLGYLWFKVVIFCPFCFVAPLEWLFQIGVKNSTSTLEYRLPIYSLLKELAVFNAKDGFVSPYTVHCCDLGGVFFFFFVLNLKDLNLT